MKRVLQPGETRNLTTYIAGNPGFGKSSLIQNMALADIRAGRGVCVIDPTGDLVNVLIHHVPRSRIADTIEFDSDRPVPIDFFSYRNPGERQLLTDQLVAAFQLDNAPVAKPRLGDILAAIFDANDRIPRPEDRYTFLDIGRFIQDEDFRRKLFKICPHRQDDWKGDFPSAKDMSAITDRLRPFRNTPVLRAMFGARNGLKIWNVMQDNQVLLINLKDTPSDYFLGSLICAKFQQAAFGRRYIKESERTPYYLYIDECHTILNYAVKEFEAILTRARKYKLCLILANQIPDDLPTEIQRKLGTIGTLILMNLDTNNAKLFRDRIKPFEIEDLVALPKFRAICRSDGRVFRLQTPTYLRPSAASYATIIRKRCMETYRCDTQSTVDNSKRDVAKPDPSPSGRPKVPLHGNEEASPR